MEKVDVAVTGWLLFIALIKQIAYLPDCINRKHFYNYEFNFKIINLYVYSLKIF